MIWLLVLSLLEKLHNQSCTNHGFIPDEGHPLLHSVHTFWDLSEVVLSNSLLGHAEGAVGAASHTQVSTTAWTNVKGVRVDFYQREPQIRSIIAT